MKGETPRLVEDGDFQDEFHVHTNATDGVDPVETMVDQAKALGYAFVGISDHSVSSAVAFGLSAEKALARRDRFRELNRERKGFTILFGTECDILDGGQMDYSDEVLKEFDFVIGAVHSRFTLPIEEMTERINAAVRHPYVNILAHPTTRKIGQRDPIRVDLDEVYAACAKAGTAIEIDAYPDRMDLNGPQARAAKNAGCTIAVDTDSHAKDHLAWMHFGVGTARRAWLTATDVSNAWPLEKIRAFFRRPRSCASRRTPERRPPGRWANGGVASPPTARPNDPRRNQVPGGPDRRSERRESTPRSCPRSPRPGANRRRTAPP